MLDINPDIKAQFASGEIRAFTLLRLVIDGIAHCFTDCDVPIPFNGALYKPRSYKLGTVSYSLAKIVDSATLALDNMDDLLTLSFVGGNPQGSETDIYLVALDADYKLIGVYPDDHVVLFAGTLDDWRMPEGNVEITITNEMVQWHQRTARMQSSSCSWRAFKGAECGYSGAATKCDRSYARCETLGNTANFGGERWLPSIEGANIWWGKTYEVST